MPRLAQRTLLAAALAGCATAKIPNTEIDDTEDTRAIVQVIEKWQKAMEDHHAQAVLELASKSYFEDFATPKADDDVGYEQLQKRLGEYMARVKRLDLAVRIKDIVVNEAGDEAHVDYFFTQRTLFSTPSGDEWREQADDNRMTLKKEDGVWKVTGGL